MGGSIQKHRERYCAVIYWNGKHERFWRHPDLPDLPIKDYAIAKSLLELIQTDIRRKNFKPEHYRPDSPISLSVFADKWLSLSTACKNTKKVYRHGINIVIQHFGAEFNITKFNHSLLLEFYGTLDRYSGDTRYKIMSGLKTMLRFYQADMPSYVLPKFPPLSQPVREETAWLTKDEQDRVLSSIVERHRPIFIVMMEYGLRPQEATALRWDCVKDGSIVFKRSHSEYNLMEHTKTGAIRIEKLTTRAAIAIKQAASMPTKKGWVFYHNEQGSHYDNKILNRLWKKACCDSEISPIGLYEAVRHSLGCQLAEEGYPIDFIQDVYKHTSIKTTRRYAKRDRGQIADALENRGKVIEFNRKEMNAHE